jgi:hypothetical protein
MHFVYGFCDENARRAKKKSQRQYAGHTQPNRYELSTVPRGLS